MIPPWTCKPPRYNVQIAAPQTFEAMPGTVITAAQIGLPQQVFAQYSGLPFALAERQDDGAMTVSAGASITVYYTLPLKLSVQDSPMVRYSIAMPKSKRKAICLMCIMARAIRLPRAPKPVRISAASI